MPLIKTLIKMTMLIVIARSLPGLSRDRSESPPAPRLVSNSAKEEVRKRSKYRLRFDLLLIPTKGWI